MQTIVPRTEYNEYYAETDYRCPPLNPPLEKVEPNLSII